MSTGAGVARAIFDEFFGSFHFEIELLHSYSFNTERVSVNNSLWMHEKPVKMDFSMQFSELFTSCLGKFVLLSVAQ